MNTWTIHQKIQAYCANSNMTDRHVAEYSWLHCYRHFHRPATEALALDRDHAALHLGFYLASWGMFRRSFLRWHSYTVHLGVIDQLVAPRFSALWKQEFGIGDNDSSLAPLILDAINAVREAYGPFAPQAGASDTLVTKVLFATFGCLPACDTYFRAGFRNCGFRYSCPDAAFVDGIFRFCKDHLAELRQEQTWIETEFAVRYPLMKIVDMCFWQIGWDQRQSKGGSGIEDEQQEL